ncbi:MAG: Rne/Rng family ribonuclease, partial [Pseudomonadota bacterium]
MVKRMLIDAARPGETRVAVVNGNHLDDFDFETEDKRQLKGNVYLAKVTRVEPSLQAAFVEYGGNRHGFLAFSEIHPDYYRIPIADREALLAEVSGASGDTESDESDETETADEAESPSDETASADSEDDPVSEDKLDPEQAGDDDGEEPSSDPIPLIATDSKDEAAENAVIDFTDLDAEAESDSDDESDDDSSEGRSVETVGGEETGERSRKRLQSLRNRYRIQEVIKRRQILLVQVTKEERGNKGAALTTYLSLAGRYCVLMPNTPRGGGISRKIANPKDRRRMKQILESLGVPDGMAIILRTAGLERTKQEIRRDADYLLRLWDQIRENTLKSSAPTLIHEEGNLIKRAIRDLHSRETEEILVSGEDGYKAAKDFMRMLVPSHARRVKQYRNPTVPLFHRYRVESQIEALHDPIVNLKSGGYIVINPTEALVSIDVNSGKSTRERNIEETAYRTNLEAAQEVGRQLRLRDLAGLIVIDFIDMDEHRHNSAVERRIKEAMRLDRARVQIGRISHFGLLELSRQRLRPSLQELDYVPCDACGGTGQVRTLGSSARKILRAIEEEGIRQRHAELLLTAPTDVILTLMNDQREALRDVEERYQIRVVIGRDDALPIGEQKIEGTAPKAAADRLEVEGLAEEIEEDEADQEDTESAS